MLRKQKKIYQPVIKEDTLVATYNQTVDWFEVNKKRISTASGIIVVCLIALWFYYNNMRTKNENAMIDFAKVFTYYDNGQYQTAIDGIPERGISGLQSIVDNYGGTEAGNIAKFYLASSFYNLQKFDKALQYFDDVSTKVSLLEVSSLAGAAACYEAKSHYEDAAKLFEKAGKKNPSDPNVADNLNSAARNYVKIGNKERAIELYKIIKKDHPTTAAAREAQRYLEELHG